MTLLYFESLAREKAEYRAVPFHVLSQQGEDSQANAWIAGWIAAENLRGLLWGKTARMFEVIGCWNMATALLARHEALFPGDVTPAMLTTRRSADDLSSPHGHLTIRDVAEGFAKFREVWHVAALMGPEAAFNIVLPTQGDTYSYAAKFITSELGLASLCHPFVGALLEVAMLAFVDPFMTDQSTVVWEDIHPGLRLEQIVQDMRRLGQKVPEDFAECYQEALRCFGL